MMAQLMMAMSSHAEQALWDAHLNGIEDSSCYLSAMTILEKNGEVLLSQQISRGREYSVDLILTKAKKYLTLLLSLCLPMLTVVM